MIGGFQVGLFQTNYQQEGVAPAVVVDQPSNWQDGWGEPKRKKRLTDEELRALIREQRIELGILQPELPGHAIAPVAEIAKEVAEAVHDEVVAAEIVIDYASIYREAYLEAEYAIAEYKKMRRRRSLALAMMLGP